MFIHYTRTTATAFILGHIAANTMCGLLLHME